MLIITYYQCWVTTDKSNKLIKWDIEEEKPVKIIRGG